MTRTFAKLHYKQSAESLSFEGGRSVRTDSPDKVRSEKRILKFLPYIVAACFAMVSLWGARDSDIVNSDASRHAMNGALILDWIRSGELASPGEFAKRYYGHAPAISLPYHPPLFPVIEALAYSIFGVSVSVARTLIAACVAAVSILLYRLLMREYKSSTLAFATVCTFLTLKSSMWLATDVNLEFPSLAFALASLVFFREFDGKWRLRDGLLFALLAAAAVWTKQHAVFLGLLPFMYIVVARRWNLLTQSTLWIAAAVFALMVLALVAISCVNQGIGVSGQVASSKNTWMNLQSYPKWYLRDFGPALGMACGSTALMCILRRVTRRYSTPTPDDTMLSWSLAVVAMVLVLTQSSSRYLFYAYPPMIALGYSGLFAAARRWLADTSATKLLTAVAVLVVGVNLVNGPQPQYMRGVGAAAESVLRTGARRILYCGYSDGSFTFACRSCAATEDFMIVRADKLEEDTFEPETFWKFAHQYGIESVVFEDTTTHYPWDRLLEAEIGGLELEQEFKLESTSRRNNGSVRVYRFTFPSPDPDDPSKFALSRVGSYLGRFTNVQKILQDNGT